MLSDSDFNFVRLTEMRRLERFIAFNKDVDHIHRNHGVTPCARYIRIHYCDHCLGTLDGSQSGINGCTERDIAMFVRRAHLNHRHITAEGSASVELLSLAEEYRNIV